MRVLGCAVSDALWAHWLQLFAPPVQPFFVSDALALQVPLLPRWTRWEFRDLRLPLTFSDTFRSYAVSDEAVWVLLLDEATFAALPRELQARLLQEQLDFGRSQVASCDVWKLSLPQATAAFKQASMDRLFVWWPSLWASLVPDVQERVLLHTLLEDRLPDRSREVSAATWEKIRGVLPGAERLSGTFAWESGANCFSTVLGAFGVPVAADLWLHPGPFERWLTQIALPVEDLDVLGTVMVWRDEAGAIKHAAVSLGDGWALQKDAQNWLAPRQVLALKDLLARWQTPGWTV